MADSVNPNLKDGAATVFVVDDEPLLLDLAVTLLKPLGHKVITFRDPQLALSQLSLFKPAVIVTDFAMGKMNGLDLIRECKRMNPNQKIILLSGTVDESIYADAEFKPDRFLAKPYQVREFISLVQSFIN